MSIVSWLKRNSSAVLTVLSSIGVVGTAVLSGRATYNAFDCLKKEERQDELKSKKIRRIIPYYIPTILTGSVTIACIVSTYILDKRQQKCLTAAYALVSESYRDYRDKAKELYSDDADDEIFKSIASENFPDWKIPEGKDIFYDTYSKRYFVSKMEDVLYAIYHFNRNFQLRGIASINEFYDFLCIEKIKSGNLVGYNWHELAEEGIIPWIDIYTEKAVNCDGTKFYVLSYMFDPIADYEDWEPDF
ncbi:MAG: DUF6353 family protein [Clostridia bacterium]|nr:DUF6353 family protein [Clostridia bacterium]